MAELTGIKVVPAGGQGGGAAPDAPPGAAPSKAPATAREHYIDWLRVALTALVVVHHCVCTYGVQISMWWRQLPGDATTMEFLIFFTSANQAYFMGLFFFLSGYFTPPSFDRKGMKRFLLDRAVRLLPPCLVYSLLVPPLIAYINASAPPATGESLAAIFRTYFTKPLAFNIASGPMWFVWMLFWFQVAYAVIRALASSCTSRRTRGHAAPQGAAPALAADAPEFSARQMLLGGGALAASLSAVCGAAAVGMACTPIGVEGFFSLYAIVAMPTFFPQYVATFSLGCTVARSWRVPARLPAAWGWPLLAGAGTFWVCIGYVPWAAGGVAVIYDPKARTSAPGLYLGLWFARIAIYQVFAVLWSTGLLIVARDVFNSRPGAAGRVIIGAAYAVYIVHPLFLTLFARALYHTMKASTFVANGLAISPMTLVASWLVGAGLKAIPGVSYVL